MKYLVSIFLILALCAGAYAQTPPSLDGTPVATNTGGSAGVSTASGVSTTGSSGILVVAIFSNTPGTVASVSGGGLTFTQRGTACVQATRSSYTYTAPYSSTLSSITVTTTMTASVFVDTTVFAVKGAAASPFDANGPVCATPGGSTTGASMTTAKNHDFVWCNMGLTGAGDIPGTGWTTVSGNGWFQLVMQQATSVGGTFTCTTQGASQDSSVIDAFTSDTSGGGSTASSLMMTGVGQ